MNEQIARTALIQMIERYVLDDEARKMLVAMANDQSLPSIPVRGVLHDIERTGAILSQEDADLVKDLIFFFG